MVRIVNGEIVHDNAASPQSTSNNNSAKRREIVCFIHFRIIHLNHQVF